MADKEAEDPHLARFLKMSKPVRVVYARPRTFISILIGLVAFALLPGSLRLVTRNKISLTVALPVSYMQKLKQVPGVQEVMIANWFQGTFRDNRDPKNQFARFSTEPEKLFTIYSEWKIPEDQRQAFVKDRTGCVIGRDIANNFGFKIGDKILFGKYSGTEVKVDGEDLVVMREEDVMAVIESK